MRAGVVRARATHPLRCRSKAEMTRHRRRVRAAQAPRRSARVSPRSDEQQTAVMATISCADLEPRGLVAVDGEGGSQRSTARTLPPQAPPQLPPPPRHRPRPPPPHLPSRTSRPLLRPRASHQLRRLRSWELMSQACAPESLRRRRVARSLTRHWPVSASTSGKSPTRSWRAWRRW